MSNPIYRSGKVIAEMIEMNKVIAVSALAMAGMFSTQALADESKTGFYVTGKAGASVMSLADQRFLSGMERKHQNIKAVMAMIRYSVAVSRPVMIFTRSSVFRFVRNWSFTLVEKLIRSIT